MVALKRLFLATFFVAGRVTTAPVPEKGLAVTVAEIRGVSDTAIGFRDPRSVPDSTIGVRKDKPKSTTPTKKPAKEIEKKPAKKPGKPKSCPPKRPRDLERRYLELGKDPQKNNEHQFVVSKASATVWNLSGCTAVFFWNFSMTPSAFHILCGSNEEEDGAKAAEIAVSAGADSYFVIVSQTDASHKGVRAGIMKTLNKEKIAIKGPNDKREEDDGSILELKPISYKKKDGKRFKFTASKGSTDLVKGEDDISDCSVQAQ